MLLFPHINILLIENVTITSYYGFAILAINPRNATMDSSVIKKSVKTFITHHAHTDLGSGVLLYFTHDYTNDMHIVKINNSLITENVGDRESERLLRNPQYIQHQNLVINAAGLTVLYTQQKYIANVSILKTNFTGNCGAVLFLLHYKTRSNYSITVFDQVSFVSNTASKKSSITLLLMIDVLCNSSSVYFNSTLFNNTVLQHPQPSHSSVVFIGLYRSNPFSNGILSIHFSNSVFTNTAATKLGSCIHAIDTGMQSKVLNIYLSNITAHNNFIANNNFGNTRTELIKIDNANELHIVDTIIFPVILELFSISQIQRYI